MTGGAGFIGQHLVRQLGDDGLQVLVIDDLSHGTADRLPPGTRLETVDIADAGLGLVVRGWRPQAVYHLAAQTSVPVSMRNPREDLRVNVVGTLNLLDAALSASVRRVVFVSSGGAIYGETEAPATETSWPCPTSYYGMHKLLAEMYVQAAGLSYAIARPSNVFGPGQAAGSDGAVVASFVEALETARPIRIDGDGRQTRDLVHVRDVVDALITLATATECGTWNVASGSSVSIADLADMMEAIAGSEWGRVKGSARAGDIRNSRMSAQRLRALGWRPRVPLTGGLRNLLIPASGSRPA